MGNYLTRKQHLRYLDFVLQEKLDKIASVTLKITDAISQKLGINVLSDLCAERNLLNTDVYIIERKKQNLKDNKSFLGEEISEMRENGTAH